MRKFSLENYGILRSSQIYIIENDIHKNMMYLDLKEDSTISIFENEAIILYKDEKWSIPIFNPLKNFHELISENKGIEIFNYNNARNKTDYGFSYVVSTPNGDIDYTFDIKKDQAVISFIGNKYHFRIVEYNNESVGNKIADIWIDNNGYKWIEDTVFSAKINDTNILCSLFLKCDKSNCIIVNNCPTNYCYEDKDNQFNYEIRYNKFGIPNKIIDIENKIELPVREEIWFNDKDRNNIISVYPLLFDAFNYNYIDKPLKYWSCTLVNKYTERTEIIRQIYEIYPEYLDKLKEDLMKDLDKCILHYK